MVSVGKSHPDLNTNSNVANFNPISSIYQHFNRFSTLKKKKKGAFVPEKKNQAAEKITQKDYRQHGVSLVFSALHCVRWGRDIGKEKAWSQPDSELPLPSERGSWNRWLAKSTRKEQNFTNRMFVSLVKMLKGKLEFLKKAINNS